MWNKKRLKRLCNINPINQQALELLSRREHSQAELRTKLLQRGYELTSIDACIATLAQQDSQSDTRFAEQYIRMRANRGYGPRRIDAELRQRGIDDTLIEALLDERDAMWLPHITQVKNKKFANDRAQTYQAQAKQMRFLQYRGFTTEQIKTVLGNDSLWKQNKSAAYF